MIRGSSGVTITERQHRQGEILPCLQLGNWLTWALAWAYCKLRWRTSPVRVSDAAVHTIILTVYGGKMTQGI